MPSGVSDTKGQGRPLLVDDQPLGFSVIEHVAGPDAASFCQGYKTYMVRELKPGKHPCIKCILYILSINSSHS